MEYDKSKESNRATLSSKAFIPINKKLAKLFGLEETVYLCELINKEEYFENRNELIDGWFYNTRQNMEEDCFIPYYKQPKIIDRLVAYGVIEVQIKGLPAKTHFRIKHDVLDEIKSVNVDQVIINRYNLIKQNVITRSNKSLQHNNNKENNNKEIMVSKETTLGKPNLVLGGVFAKRRQEKALVEQETPISKYDKFREDNPLPSTLAPVEKPPVRLPKQKNITPEMEDILAHWNKSGLYNPDNTKTVTHITGLNYLHDLLYKKNNLFNQQFTAVEIKRSIDHFSLAAYSNEYQPEPGDYKASLKKTALAYFIRNPKPKKIPSLFLKYLAPPAVLIEVIEDKYPILTRKLKRMINDHVRTTGKFTVVELNTIKKGAIRLAEFYQKHNHLIRTCFNTDDASKITHLESAIEWKYGAINSTVTVGHYCSEYAINSILADWFQSQALFITAESGPISEIGQAKVGAFTKRELTEEEEMLQRKKEREEAIAESRQSIAIYNNTFHNEADVSYDLFD